MTSSSLFSHLGTNYIPTDDELAEIRRWLVAPTAKLAEVEFRLSLLASEHYALHAHGSQLYHEIAQYRALASPMRRFPVDLLREVFVHCLPSTHNAIISTHQAPLLLTRVCSLWRVVALSTPALWTSLHIPIPGQYSDRIIHAPSMDRDSYVVAMTAAMRKRTRAVEEWLPRSGECKLDISLYDKEPSLFRPNANSEIFMDKLLPLSPRWRSISFTTSPHHLQRIIALTADDVPALEELTIKMVMPVDIDTPTTWLTTSFFKAPRLRSVSFKNLFVDATILPFDWQNLTYISLEGSAAKSQRFTSVVTLLAKCPRIISAKLEVVKTIPTPFFLPVPPVTATSVNLPYLINLSLRNVSTDVSQLFLRLDTPQLKSLEYYADVVQPASAFISFVNRISETLTSLTINVLQFTRTDFFDILSAARRLKSFRSPGPWSDSRNVGFDLWQGCSGPPVFDDEFLGMLVGRRLGSVRGPSKDVDMQKEGAGLTGEDVADDYSVVLLPELEELECMTSVGITDEGRYGFLNLRQNPTLQLQHLPDDTSRPSIASHRVNLEVNNTEDVLVPYTKLKKLSIAFEREASGSMFPVWEEIAFWQQHGLELTLNHNTIMSRRMMSNPFASSEGVPFVGYRW